MRNAPAAFESSTAVEITPDKAKDSLSTEVGGEVGSASTGIGPDDDDEDDRELDRLLAYCQAGSSGGAPTLTEAWQTGLGFTDQQRSGFMESDLDLFISNERSRGLDKIKAQLSHAAGVFKDLAHFVSEDQDKLDSVEGGMSGARNKTTEALAQLRIAHRRTQRARKRRIILWAVLLLCGFIFIVHLWPSWLIPGSRHPPPAVSSPTAVAAAANVAAAAVPSDPRPPEKPSFLAAGQRVAFRSGVPLPATF